MDTHTGHGPTHRPRSGRTTLHRDGTVTVWDCTRQEWIRTDSPSDTLLATMGSDERERVLRHVGG